MSGRSVRISDLSRMVAVAALAVAAAPLEAQSPLSIHVSPMVGYGNFGGALGAVPDPGGVPQAGQVVTFDGHWSLGLAAEVAWEPLPLRLRVGASRTLDGDLEVSAGSESCGAGCTKFLRADAGSAAATTLWADLVFRPLSSTFAPYLFVGGAHRIMSYGTADSTLAPYFESSDHRWLTRYGVGIDLDVVPTGTFWIEWAQDRSNRSMSQRPGVTSSARWVHETRLSAGVRLRVF